MHISPHIIYMFSSFFLSLSASRRQISSDHVYSDLLSLATRSPSNTQSTLNLTLTLTTTVVTFLFTLIKGFLFCWYCLSPAPPPPPGHRSTVTVSLFMSVCQLFCIITCYRNDEFVWWQLKPTDHVWSKVHGALVMAVCILLLMGQRCWWMNDLVSATAASAHLEYFEMLCTHTHTQQLATLLFFICALLFSD